MLPILMLVSTMVVFGDMDSQLSELPLLPLKLQHPLLRLKQERSVKLMLTLTQRPTPTILPMDFITHMLTLMPSHTPMDMPDIHMLELMLEPMLEPMVLTHTLLDITDIAMLSPSPLRLKSLLLRLKPGRSVMPMPKLTQLSLLLPPLSHTLLSPTLSHMPPTEPMLGMDIHMPMDLDTPHMDTPTLDMLDSDIMEDRNLPPSFVCNFKELNPKSYFG